MRGLYWAHADWNQIRLIGCYYLVNVMEQSSCEAVSFLASQKFPYFRVSGGSAPWSQLSVDCPYPKEDLSSSRPIHFL
jgi:hypothetical protein